MIRFGLCCIFREQPIRFRRATAKHMEALSQKKQRHRLSELCLQNANSLLKALNYCHDQGIGDFRINSQILPLKTHPAVGYDVTDLPNAENIIHTFQACGRFCRRNDIRTTFHPDQFIVLNSPSPVVVERSIADLTYQAQVARWVGADVINIHAGGVYGDKQTALFRLQKNIDQLPSSVRTRLTLENDDRSYSPADLLPVCKDMEIPLVYDVHHHRCLPDDISTEKATEMAVNTWNGREPLFHISSPINGWGKPDIRKHHDDVDIHDFPKTWLSLNATVEVEAKAKELAVLKLMDAIASESIR